MLSFSLPEPQPLSAIFTFKALPVATRPLQFKKKPSTRLSPKRSRPVADVDDGDSSSKKKRRLRLYLITSRLSRPFSTPATHIVDPGTSKIAVWAKQRHLTQQVLRKAAIMNRVRRKTLERKDSGISVGEDERREARENVMKGVEVKDAVAAGLGPNAICHLQQQDWNSPTNDSPLGLSNYDALDDEDDWYDSYHDEDEEADEALPRSPKAVLGPKVETVADKAYYADWNLRDADEEDENDDDSGVFDALPAELVSDKRPPSPPEGRIVEILKEQEREQEIISGFRHFT